MRFLILALVLALGTACATWNSFTPEQKLSAVTDAMEIVVKPECLRFARNLDGGTNYVELCEEIFDDVIAAVRAGVLKDASEICPRIASKVARCSAIPGEFNVAACERLVRVSDLACRVFTQERAEPESAPVEPEV